MGFHGVCIYEVPLSYSYWDFDRVYQHLTGGIYIYRCYIELPCAQKDRAV